MREQVKISDCDISVGNLIFFFPRKKSCSFWFVFSPQVCTEQSKQLDGLRMATALFSFAGLQQRAGAGRYPWRFSFSRVVPLLSFLHISQMFMSLIPHSGPYELSQTELWNVAFVEAVWTNGLGTRVSVRSPQLTDGFHSGQALETLSRCG